MFVVDQVEIFNWDFTLFSSLSQLSSFMALLSTTSQIYYLCLFNFYHRLKAWIQGFEDLELAFIHVAEVFHQLRKDILVSQDTSFWNFELIWVFLNCLFELLNSCEDSKDLEGEAPSSRLLVVFVEHIDVGTIQVLPFCDRLFDPLGFRDPLP